MHLIFHVSISKYEIPKYDVRIIIHDDFWYFSNKIYTWHNDNLALDFDHIISILSTKNIYNYKQRPIWLKNSQTLAIIVYKWYCGMPKTNSNCIHQPTELTMWSRVFHKNIDIAANIDNDNDGWYFPWDEWIILHHPVDRFIEGQVGVKWTNDLWNSPELIVCWRICL